MSERWVVNASPLIALSRIGCAGWLARLADDVVVPQAVVSEIQAGPPDAARQFVATGLLPVAVVPPAPVEVSDWALGAGESAVLAWAWANPGWTAIIDDLPARRCAKALGLPHKGTLAVVILARQRGLTDSAAEVVRSLRHAGLHLDDAVVRAALAATVGEAWPIDASETPT